MDKEILISPVESELDAILYYYRKAPSHGKLAAMAILLYNAENNELRDSLKGRTKCEYKRAIKRLREAQSEESRLGHDSFVALYENVIAFIRRDLMEAQNRATERHCLPLIQ